MESLGIASLILITANILVSYQGFSNKSFFEKYEFNVDGILVKKEYYRLITSGFLHVDWKHLTFNMISLFFFSSGLEHKIGVTKFLIIYSSSLIGGDLFALFIHRHHGDYRAVGASGAVCGIIFASIALFPNMSISLFLLPLFIPGWLYGIGYMLYSIYGIKSKTDNIGHEAHFGGAITGLIIAVILYPSSLSKNYFAITIILIPAVIFIYFIFTRPGFLLVDNYFQKGHKFLTKDERYNAEKKKQQDEIDRILEKIHKKGIDSLTKKEKDTLDSLSK